MSRARMIQGEIWEKNERFLGLYLKVRNAGLILFSEGEDQLGTLALAIPRERGEMGTPLSSIILGDRNMMITRILAERLAGKIDKIALASVFVKTIDEMEAGQIFLKLFEQIVGKEEE